MTRVIHGAWAIARRDYVATVRSRAFLIFLIGPLLPLLFGGAFAALGRDDGRGADPPIGVAMPAGDMAALQAARARIAGQLGRIWLPPLVPAHAVPPGAAILGGSLAAPRLAGTADAIDALHGRVSLLIETARAPPSHGRALAIARLPGTGVARAHPRRGVGEGAQLVLFVLTMVLAGMLISNLVEEKANKVIEVLAAAVPVDAIFAGKLAGMLGVSLTAITVWGALGAGVAGALLPHAMATLPAPAVGWPLFVGLGLLYFVMVYLLIGALYLGIGAQAGSAREVQTLSLPLTMAQLAAFALASAAVKHPGGALDIVATALPWSSPLTMIARAAEWPAVWPHLLALGWQALCLALAIRLMAALFRRTVLSGGGSQSSGGRLSKWMRRDAK